MTHADAIFIMEISKQKENRSQKSMPRHNTASKKSFRYIDAMPMRLPLLGATGCCGCAFGTAPVADDPAVAIQLVPQAKPVGQHPPPAVSAQLNQPLAQRATPVPPLDAAVPVVLPAGTTMVRPSDVKVELDVIGQEVVSQFRPVRQHPP